MQPSSTVQLLFVGGKPSGIQLPSSIELAVTDTQPGVKGDTVSNVTKPATLETGAVVQVPLFVNPGDKIKVDPRERPLHLPRLTLRPSGLPRAKPGSARPLAAARHSRRRPVLAHCSAGLRTASDEPKCPASRSVWELLCF